MNLFVLFFACVGSFATVIAQNDSNSSTPIYTTPTKVVFSCNGMDKKGKVSVGAITFMAKILEESFNKIHQKIDDGDIFLLGTHFLGRNRGKVSDETVESEDEDKVGRWGRMDWTYVSGWGCRLCEKSAVLNDISSVGSTNNKPADVTMWESEFATRLVESGYPTFQAVRSCNIKLSASDAQALSATVKEEDTPIYTTPTEVDFTCTGMEKKGKISVGAITFMAKTLEDSFNHVHQKIDNGDVFFSGTHFVGRKRGTVSDETVESEDEDKVGRWGRMDWTYVSGWGCRLCEKSVAFDRVSNLRTNTKPADIIMWESEFATRLVDSGIPVFQGIRSCSIKLGAALTVEDENLMEG